MFKWGTAKREKKIMCAQYPQEENCALRTSFVTPRLPRIRV